MALPLAWHPEFVEDLIAKGTKSVSNFTEPKVKLFMIYLKMTR